MGYYITGQVQAGCGSRLKYLVATQSIRCLVSPWFPLSFHSGERRRSLSAAWCRRVFPLVRLDTVSFDDQALLRLSQVCPCVRHVCPGVKAEHGPRPAARSDLHRAVSLARGSGGGTRRSDAHLIFTTRARERLEERVSWALADALRLISALAVVGGASLAGTDAVQTNGNRVAIIAIGLHASVQDCAAQQRRVPSVRPSRCEPTP